MVFFHRHDMAQPLVIDLHGVTVGSPAKNRFFHRNIANWVSWEREFKKKENGGKMSSIGKI